MHYYYELCPNCMDKLVERYVDDFEDYIPGHCSNCGGKMEVALSGKRKAEETTYKITLNKIRDMDKNGEKCLDIIMQVSGLDAEAAMEKMRIGGSVLFEGDLLGTYLNLRLLDRIEYMIDYSVTPDFSYAREMLMMCPECGEETHYKLVEEGEESVKGGFYCEKCGDWVLLIDFSRSDADHTEYCIEASLAGTDEDVKKEILQRIEYLWDRKIDGDQIKARDQSSNIRDILGIMKAYNVPYEINPPYPHEIVELHIASRHKWTEEEIKALMDANPGLNITAEEMNALN